MNYNAGIFNYFQKATTTIIGNTNYAWSFATSTTALPILTFDTTAGGDGVFATTTINGGLNVDNGNLLYDYSNGITSVNSFQTGNLNFDTDAGMVSWADLTLSSASADTPQGYTAFLNGSSTISIYGLSNASGYLRNDYPRVSIGSTGVGTTTPTSKLTVFGNGVGVGGIFELVDNASTTLMKVLDNGKVGIGITNPSYTLDVSGFINTNKFSGYLQDAKLFAYASSTNLVTILGFGAGGQNATTSATAAGTVAVGYEALNSQTTGTQNTAVGYQALKTTLTGSSNTAIGYQAGTKVTGSSNSFLGNQVSSSNTVSGSNSTGIGAQALQSLTSGGFNTSVGMLSFSSLQTGTNNTGLGYQVGNDTTGSNNIFIGYNTASTTSTGSNNIAIGYDIATPSITSSNTLNIGNLIFGTSIDGEGTNLSTGNIGIATTSPWRKFDVNGTVGMKGLTSTAAGDVQLCLSTNNEVTTGATCGASSRRFKENILNITDGLDLVRDLNPVSFNFIGISGTHVGFIAEEVNQIDPRLVIYDDDGVTPKGVRYQDFPPLLAGAIKAVDTRTRFIQGSSTVPTLFVDTDGNLGVGMNDSNYKLYVDGEIGAEGFVNISTRSAKKDIGYVTNNQKSSIFESIRDIKVAQYRYNNELDNTPLHLGLIAEEAPPEILSVSGKGVDLYKFSSFMLLGVQELQNRFDSLDIRLTNLETVANLFGSSTLSTIVASSSMEIASSTIAILFDHLKSLGTELTATVAKFAHIVVDAFTVGSPSKPTGITLFDEVTSAPYCLKVSNGQIKSIPGECVASSPTASSTNITIPISSPAPTPIIETIVSSTTTMNLIEASTTTQTPIEVSTTSTTVSDTISTETTIPNPDITSTPSPIPTETSVPESTSTTESVSDTPVIEIVPLSEIPSSESSTVQIDSGVPVQ